MAIPAPTPYLYNGKEMVCMHGLNQLNYGARWYDPSLGRWGELMDPLVELTPWQSPFVYCSSNPINMIDPTGMFGEAITSTFVDDKQRIIEHQHDGDPKVYLVKNESEWKAKGSSKKGLDRVGDEDPWVNYKKR